MKGSRVLRAAAMALVLTGSTVAVSAAPGGAAPAPVSIVYWSGHASGALHRAVVAEVAMFNRTHPGIHVTFRAIAAQNHAMAAFESGQAPNVGLITGVSRYQLEKAHVIVNLAPFISGRNGLTRAQIHTWFYPVVWAAMHDPDGAQYLMPNEKKSQVDIYYNESLFKQAGIKSPPRTWAQVGADAAAISRLGHEDHGIAWTPRVTQYFDMVLADGGRVYRPGPRRRAFDLQNAGAVRALTMLRSWVKSGAMILTSGYQFQLDFGTGHIGLLIDSAAGYTYDKSAVGGKFVMGGAPDPAGTAGFASQEISGTSNAMFNVGTAAQKAAAWTFMKWMASPATNAYWSRHTNYLPLGPAAYQLLKGFYRRHPAEAANYSNPAHWWFAPRTPNDAAVTVALRAIFDKALNGTITPAQAVHQMDVTGTAYLSGKERG